MRVYGVCNHSPDCIFSWLKKSFELGPSEIQILPETNILPKRPKKGVSVVLFLSNKSFRRNLEQINSKPWKKVTGILFASPIDLASYENITPLDFEQSDDLHLDAFLLKGINKENFVLKGADDFIDRNRTDYLQTVMDHIKSFGSLLNPLMTFIYKLPSATHQKPIKEIICHWLYEGQSIDKLESKLAEKANSLTLSKKQKQYLLELLSSDIAEKYKNALSDYRMSSEKDDVKIKQCVSVHEVSAYELRYILSIALQE